LGKNITDYGDISKVLNKNCEMNLNITSLLFLIRKNLAGFLALTLRFSFYRLVFTKEGNKLVRYL